MPREPSPTRPTRRYWITGWRSRRSAGVHRGFVEAALKKHGGNVSKASESLGLDRGNFQRILRRYGLQASDYRDEG